VFTLSFMVLRSYTGGYHSDSRIFCYLGSNLVLLVPVYTQAVFYKTSLARLLAVLLVSAGIIFLLSPMHSKNRKLDKEEQKHFGRKARLIAVLELAVLGILWYAGQIPYAYAVYTGICITALFMIVGKAQLWIQSHTENG
jgi:accessory gene regulator B